MPTPEKAAEAVLAVLPRLRQTTRGSFVDIRQLD
jgi:hypothetical protein